VANCVTLDPAELLRRPAQRRVCGAAHPSAALDAAAPGPRGAGQSHTQRSRGALPELRPGSPAAGRRAGIRVSAPGSASQWMLQPGAARHWVLQLPHLQHQHPLLRRLRVLRLLLPPSRPAAAARARPAGAQHAQVHLRQRCGSLRAVPGQVPDQLALRGAREQVPRCGGQALLRTHRGARVPARCGAPGSEPELTTGPPR